MAAKWKADNADAKVLVTGRNLDLQDSPSSLGNVQSVINAATSAVLAGNPAPPGVKVESTAQRDLTKKLSPAVSDTPTPQLLISGHAFDTISDIIHGFGGPATVAFNSSAVSQDLGFGLHMFVGVGERVLASTSLFDNQKIYAYVYTYQVHYSQRS